MAKKKKKKKARRKTRKTRRKNPTRRCSNCRSAKHDRRKCKSKKRSKKSKKTRRRRKRRRNPGVADSLTEMGLSYAYTKPNPCVTCGCTCKDGTVDTTRHSYNQGTDRDVAAGASRFLRSRRNPGWSFKKGRAIPHEQQFEDLYQRPLSSRFGRHRTTRNPCGSRRHRTTRNPYGFYGPLSRRLRRNPSTPCSNCGTGNDPSRRETCWKCGFDLASSPEGRIAATRRRAMGGMSWH
jgi:hypothetical protein